jgi:hypothetical protein
MVNEWHLLYGRRWPQSQCAGCGEPIADRAALTLADNNRVHFEDVDCLLRYGERWGGAAVTALHRFGLDLLAEFEAFPIALARR